VRVDAGKFADLPGCDMTIAGSERMETTEESVKGRRMMTSKSAEYSRISERGREREIKMSR